MNEYKLVFTGTTGAGKTTAINAVSETPTIKTDVANTDESLDKALTTVGLDLGKSVWRMAIVSVYLGRRVNRVLILCGKFWRKMHSVSSC